MSIQLGQMGSQSAHNIGSAFEAQGKKQAAALQPATFDEAMISNIIQKKAFQMVIFGASILSLIPGVFLRRTYGERSFGLKSLLTAVLVFWVGFGAARDPQNDYLLSWFGPLFVVLWIMMFAFHRIEIFIRKLKRKPHVWSRTQGRPWIPWSVLPHTRRWANTIPGFSIITMYLDPIIVFTFGSIAATLVSAAFGATFVAAAFAMFTIAQMTSYMEQQKILDQRDAEVEAKFRLAMSENMHSTPKQSVGSFDGFVVAIPPQPKVPKFLESMPAFKVEEPTVAEPPVPEPMPLTLPPLPESVRVKAEPAPQGDLISELDPTLQDLVKDK